MDAIVQFGGFHMRHFYYAVHQAVEYPEAELSTFGVTITCGDDLHVNVVGGWLWDGVTRPGNARANIEQTYGCVASLWVLLHSAVDQRRYDSVNSEHGFFPYVAVEDRKAGSFKLYGPAEAPTHASLAQGLKAFVTANPDYCHEVSQCLEPIPRNFASFD
ncbi:hypothetical protein [Pseudomonas sp. 6D_7.1_Bac1]|uniref:hypothetical protein n=1 Tax=Pseudomonas sp. 6D_7.1_Bac1 TaxID=2971615 RepID=UPI0021C71196|nr:hypothetical protein [Pseudomonas sp. 6D_7.1_Bac1]MCU1752789.1 hypothetical protein [Pseudomonas sp. 6D_7.1_Bac1]